MQVQGESIVETQGATVANAKDGSRKETNPISASILQVSVIQKEMTLCDAKEEERGVMTIII